MNKAKPKNYVMITVSNFTGQAKVYLHCYPQQIWHYKIHGNECHLTYKHIDLVIPKEDFEKYWRVIE